MTLVESKKLPLGIPFPFIQLPEVRTNKIVQPKPTNYKGILVVFLCAHCPYVKHIIAKLSELSFLWIQRGLFVVGISSNSFESHPEDSPEGLQAFAQKHKILFPLCFDENQEVAKKFQAQCTPECFLYDQKGKLVYHGQFDSSRPENKLPVTGIDLVKAIQGLIQKNQISKQQMPSSGCSIKWKNQNQDHSSSK